MTAPRPTEAIVLANLLSNVAEALKKAALDLRMIESLEREAADRATDAAAAKTEQQHEIDRRTVAHQRGIDPKNVVLTTDDSIRCARCGHDIPTTGLRIRDIACGTVVCPVCSRDARCR